MLDVGPLDIWRTWLEASSSRTVTIGKRILIPGVRYTVTHAFSDDDGQSYTAGQTLIFRGAEYPKMYPGYVLHFSTQLDDGRLTKLRWKRDHINFEDLLQGPPTKALDVLSRLPDSERARLERTLKWLGEIPESAEQLIVTIQKAMSDSEAAEGRSGRDNPFLQASADLRGLENAVIRAMGESTEKTSE